LSAAEASEAVQAKVQSSRMNFIVYIVTIVAPAVQPGCGGVVYGRRNPAKKSGGKQHQELPCFEI
jgi:hypothetical protein